MEAEWRKNKERINVFILTLLLGIHTLFGRSFSLLIMRFVAIYHLGTNQYAVNHSRKYLQKLLHRKVLNKDIFLHFYHFAVVTYDRLNFTQNKFNNYELNISINDENKSEINLKGSIFITSHVGSFEIMRSLGLHKKETLISIVIDARHNQKIYDFLKRQSGEEFNIIDSSCFSSIGLVFEIVNKVNQGHTVGIMADRFQSHEAVKKFRFLDAEAYFPSGIFTLVARQNIPIIAGFGLYTGKNKYEIKLHNIRQSSIDGQYDKKQLAEVLQKRYVHLLEKTVRKYPYNWFNFYDFWKLNYE